MRDYLRGLIDGDGTIVTEPVEVGGKSYMHPRLSIASASLGFLESVNSGYLDSAGSIEKKKGCWALCLESRPKIIDVLSWCYSGNGFCLERKRAKFLEILAYDLKMSTNVISAGTLRGLARKQELHML